MFKETDTPLAKFIREKRKKLNLTQPEIAAKSGVGLRFVRDLEQGKATVRIDKVNQLLALFGHEVGPVPIINRRLDEEIG